MSRKRFKPSKPLIGRRADSPKQEAARTNGALSRGPVTPEGKAISSQNALKHGIYSAKLVLPNESQEEFDRYREAYITRFRPADLVELDLIEEIVSCRWRMRRINAMETRALEMADDVAASTLEHVLNTFRRHESSLARQADKAAKRLEQLQAERRANETAPTGKFDADAFTAQLAEMFGPLPEICGNEPTTAQPESNQPATAAPAPPLAIGA